VGCPISLLQMKISTHTSVDNHKLSPWYFAVHWAIMVLQQKIAAAEAAGFDAAYDVRQLLILQDMEMFLKLSWDQWLDQIEARQTELETK